MGGPKGPPNRHVRRRKLAVNKTHMKTIIRRNGHLRLEGDESTDELKDALFFLRAHTYQRCAMPEMGIPIEALLPDISVLVARPMSTRNARTRTVDIRRERL